MYLKDIIKSSSNIKETFPLVEGFHVCNELDTEQHKAFYNFILDNYNLQKAKYFTLRPHDVFILGRYWEKFTNTYYKNQHAFYIDLIYNVYIPQFERILKTYHYACSVEVNPKPTSGMNFIHFHFVLFVSNKTLKEVVKSLKTAYSMSNKFIYKTMFDKVVNIPDPSVMIKSYDKNEKHYALLYYMGFDKRSIGKDLIQKDSYYTSIYSICRSPKSFTLLNKAYALFPYKEKNLKKK